MALSLGFRVWDVRPGVYWVAVKELRLIYYNGCIQV